MGGKEESVERERRIRKEVEREEGRRGGARIEEG